MIVHHSYYSVDRLDVPAEQTWKLTENASYFFYCSNETIDGIEIDEIPSIVPKGTPIVCDMSSNFLTRPIDVSKVKTHPRARISILSSVTVRSELCQCSEELRHQRSRPCDRTKRSRREIDEQIHSGQLRFQSPDRQWIDVQHSTDIRVGRKATSNQSSQGFFAFRIYIANKIFEWTKKQGGIEGCNQQSEKKSSLVYQMIDQSNGFYVNRIDPKYRSRVNIPLRIVTDGTPNEKLESLFLSEAVQANMIELKGHRAVGGIRVSLYNGINLDQTKLLIDFMQTFQKNQS